MSEKPELKENTPEKEPVLKPVKPKGDILSLCFDVFGEIISYLKLKDFINLVYLNKTTMETFLNHRHCSRFFVNFQFHVSELPRKISVLTKKIKKLKVSKLIHYGPLIKQIKPNEGVVLEKFNQFLAESSALEDLKKGLLFGIDYDISPNKSLRVNLKKKLVFKILAFRVPNSREDIGYRVYQDYITYIQKKFCHIKSKLILSFSRSLLKKIFKVFPHITHLELPPKTIVSEIFLCKKLEMLKAGNCLLIDHLFSNLQNLKFLNLKGCSITDKMVENLAEYCKNLVNLNLKGNKFVTKTGVFKKFNSLKLLNLSRTGVKLEEKSLENLEDISFLDLSKLKGEDNKSLGKLKNVKWLNLSGTKITDLGLERLKEAKFLKCLYINNCFKVKGSGIEFLSALQSFSFIVDPRNEETFLGISLDYFCVMKSLSSIITKRMVTRKEYLMNHVAFGWVSDKWGLKCNSLKKGCISFPLDSIKNLDIFFPCKENFFEVKHQIKLIRKVDSFGIYIPISSYRESGFKLIFQPAVGYNFLPHFWSQSTKAVLDFEIFNETIRKKKVNGVEFEKLIENAILYNEEIEKQEEEKIRLKKSRLILEKSGIVFSVNNDFIEITKGLNKIDMLNMLLDSSFFMKILKHEDCTESCAPVLFVKQHKNYGKIICSYLIFSDVEIAMNKIKSEIEHGFRSWFSYTGASPNSKVRVYLDCEYYRPNVSVREWTNENKKVPLKVKMNGKLFKYMISDGELCNLIIKEVVILFKKYLNGDENEKSKIQCELITNASSRNKFSFHLYFNFMMTNEDLAKFAGKHFRFLFYLSEMSKRYESIIDNSVYGTNKSLSMCYCQKYTQRKRYFKPSEINSQNDYFSERIYNKDKKIVKKKDLLLSVLSIPKNSTFSENNRLFNFNFK